MSRQRRALEARIEAIKTELAQLGEIRPGSLSRQYNVCGSAGCQCKADPPRKHGPYYQLSFFRHGKSRSQFVRREDLPRVRQQVRNYTRMRKLVDQWIDLSLRLVSLERETSKSKS